MSKQCLDVQQMQHLQELGLDTSNASMLYCDLYDEEYILVESKHRFDKEENAILLEGVRISVIYCKKVTPVYTLQDVLDALPKMIYPFPVYKIGIELWICSGKIFYANMFNSEDVLKVRYNNELIDAAYELLVWCIENKFVETNKNE